MVNSQLIIRYVTQKTPDILIDIPPPKLYHNARPTDKAQHLNEGGWYMKGIEVRGKCPVTGCNRNFSRSDKNNKPWPDNDFHCKEHSYVTPKYYILKFKHKGKWVCRGTNFAAETLRTYQDACKLKAIAESEISQGIFSVRKWNIKLRSEYLFDDLIEEWYSIKKVKMQRGEITPTYLKQIDANIRNHFCFFNGKDVRDIHELHAFDSQLALQASSRSVTVGILAEFFNWLMEVKRLIVTRPAIPKINIKDKPLITASREVQEDFLTVVDSCDLPIFAWMIYQGCRIAEVCALKWDCINSEEEKNDVVIYKRTFSGGSKETRILKENTKVDDGGRDNFIWPDTRKYLPNKSFGQNFVFTDPKGQPYISQNLSAKFRTYLRRYNKKFNDNLSISLYKFTKHSFGTHMLKLYPEQAYALQKHFGHSTVAMMEKYARIEVANVWRRISRIGQFSSTRVPQGPSQTRMNTGT